MINHSLAHDIEQIIITHGFDILHSPGMDYEKNQRQHSDISCFEHSLNVAYVSVWLTAKLRLKTDTRSIVRGALLHDYFLYDWHDSDDRHNWHGFVHAEIALQNAVRDFPLSDIEKDIIQRHMFPLNITPPKYTESFIGCFADKICAGMEVVSALFPISMPGIRIGRAMQ